MYPKTNNVIVWTLDTYFTVADIVCFKQIKWTKKVNNILIIIHVWNPHPLKKEGGRGGGGWDFKISPKMTGFQNFLKKGGIVKIGEVVVKKRVSLTETSPF